MPTIRKLPKQKNIGDKKKIRAKYYNKVEWKKLRQWHLMQHPLCEKCLDEYTKNEDGTIEQRITPAEDVHHIISPFTFDDENTIMQYLLNDDNLMSLCKWHHAQQHIRKKKKMP